LAQNVSFKGNNVFLKQPAPWIGRYHTWQIDFEIAKHVLHVLKNQDEFVNILVMLIFA